MKRLNRRMIRMLIESIVNEESESEEVDGISIPKQKSAKDFEDVEDFFSGLGFEDPEEIDPNSALGKLKRFKQAAEKKGKGLDAKKVTDPLEKALKTVKKKSSKDVSIEDLIEIDPEIGKAQDDFDKVDDFLKGMPAFSAADDYVDDKIDYYTLANDSKYAYSGKPGSWTAYLQSDLKDGKTDPFKYKGKEKSNFKSTELDKQYKAGTLKKFKPENLSEGLSRGSLYRRRYRRY